MEGGLRTGQESPADRLGVIGEELERCKRKAGRQRGGAGAPGSCRAVLAELLGEVRPVDFARLATLAGLPDGEKIKQKNYVTLAVKELLGLATSGRWGLACRDGFVYVYNGAYWQLMGGDDFKAFLAEAAVRMGIPKIKADYYQFRDDLYKQFLSAANLQPPEKGDSTLVNLANGTFEISGGFQGLREFDRGDFLKYQLGFNYDPGAACPLFDRYLSHVLPDEGCRRVLSEYVGYVFLGNRLRLEKALILYGGGANGKSVFFDVVRALLGRDNICSYSLQNLTKGDGYQRAELANKLLNYASEINGRLEASIFKQLVSGEPVEARQIYGKPFIMEDYARLMFNCNELPRDVEQTDAFFRRFLIVPFTVAIPPEEQDPELSRKIIAGELPGVFNWVLGGLRRLLRQRKFTESELVRGQVEAYRRDSDSVAVFVDETGYFPDTLNKVSLQYMYEEYRVFSGQNGYICVSIKTFSARLERLGFEKVRQNNGRFVFASVGEERKKSFF